MRGDVRHVRHGLAALVSVTSHMATCAKCASLEKRTCRLRRLHMATCAKCASLGGGARVGYIAHRLQMAHVSVTSGVTCATRATCEVARRPRT